MFFTFDLCLLLYVIRLAGWLKHCNLSLSLSLSTLQLTLLSHRTQRHSTLDSTNRQETLRSAYLNQKVRQGATSKVGGCSTQ